MKYYDNGSILVPLVGALATCTMLFMMSWYAVGALAQAAAYKQHIVMRQAALSGLVHYGIALIRTWYRYTVPDHIVCEQSITKTYNPWPPAAQESVWQGILTIQRIQPHCYSVHATLMDHNAYFLMGVKCLVTVVLDDKQPYYTITQWTQF